MTGNNKINENDLLRPDNMLYLYAHGAFPMAEPETNKINWYLPEKRTIIPLNNYNIPKSLRKFISTDPFEIRYDYDVMRVIKKCASRKITWISHKLIKAYRGLLEKGNLHSVETWQNGKLVGGLYGVTYRAAFFGESMFSAVSQASKVALYYLIQHLIEKNFTLLDVQFLTEHLKMFGAVEISTEEYKKLLLKSYKTFCKF